MTEEQEDVFRCMSCKKLVRRDQLSTHGCCQHCGNRRVENVKAFNDEERALLLEWGCKDFVELFEPIDE